MQNQFSKEFSKAYAMYANTLFWRAYHMLGDMEEAKDVVNDTFVEAMLHQNWWGVQKNSIKQRYLVDTCERICRVMLERRGRMQFVELFDEEKEAPIEQQEYVIVQESMRQYMNALSMEDKRILFLRYFLGYEMAQIADAEGISVANAAQRLLRSRRRLKIIIENDIEKPLPDE